MPYDLYLITLSCFSCEQLQEVLNYFQQLTKCMGDNIEFNAEIISKGEDDDHYTIAVYWHLGIFLEPPTSRNEFETV